MTVEALLTGLSVFVLAGGLLFMHRRLWGVLPEDHPGPTRKNHKRPTPMLGALPALAAVLVLGWHAQHLAATAVAIAGAVGLLDDVRKGRGREGSAWQGKAIGQASVAALVVYALPNVPSMGLGLALAVLVFVLINAFNFLDNLDGVSTLLGVVALTTLGLQSDRPIAFSLAAAFLGFLPWNWPRATLFLGDAGAYALGAAVATQLVPTLAADLQRGVPAVALALSPVAIPLLDFAQVVSVRILLGIAPWRADRRHLTHILLHLGVARTAVAPLLAAVAVGIVALW
jgi:UDP-GlcNAc:undecaprenyl-phosphate GlcNAc-1-phosphate transferase